MIMDLQIGDSFYSAIRNFFWLYINNSAANKISKKYPRVVHIVMQNGSNNGAIHRSLKYFIQNFKISLKNMKIWNQDILYILKKTRKRNWEKSIKRSPRCWTISFYSKDIPTFNELVIKNTLVKKQDYFCFYGRVSLAS